MTVRRLAVLPLLLLGVHLAAQSGGPPRFNEELLEAISFRNLGPFRAGAWVADIAVPETPAKAHLYTFYVAVRHGGLWKTANNGTTFEPLFDAQSTLAMGCVTTAPSNGDIVWVGTGDASNARSAYPGDGVYKSVDGGRTWQHMGLRDSHHVARIAIHPANPDIVWVAAMGHLFTRNEERGVFKTTDGGKTWKKVLYVNDRVGAIDLVVNRRSPDTLYAAMYEKERFPWLLVEGGPASGIYKSTDAGATWRRLEGGLPTGKIGRIGLDIYQKNPTVLYAVVENVNRRPPTEDEAKQDRARNLEPQDRPIGGEVYRTDDAGRTWRTVNAATDDVGGKAAYSFNQLRIDQNNDQRVFVTGQAMQSSDDGGKTWKGLTWPPNGIFQKAFGDFRCFWIDPLNSDRMIAGSDGGVHVSYDGGRTCDHYVNLPLGEVYAVGVDMENPYNIYAGLQDHEVWKGPSNGASGRIGLEDWVTVGEGDGMYNQVDPTDSRWLFHTREFGSHTRVDQKLRTRTRIVPTRPAGQPPLRFNWVAPIRLSPHNPAIVYAGAQVVFRSVDRGDHWEEISPDLTTNNKAKTSAPAANIPHCTITTLAESPRTPGVIWVGTDDGKVQVTRNHGATWTDVTNKIAAAGGPEGAWVTRVLPSAFETGTAYVAKSAHRSDVFRPMLLRTTDFGATWTSLAANLPERPVNVIVEDAKKPDLLFVGTDNGVYVSIDGGRRWVRMGATVPNVPVHDLAVHPREGDLVAGTYGRGVFVTDITLLREMSEEVLNKDVHFFAVEPKARRTDGAWGNYQLYGDRYATTANEPNGLVFNIYVKAPDEQKATVTVADPFGAVVRVLNVTVKGGLNRAVWSLAERGGKAAPPGEYVATLEIGGAKYTQRARILG